MSPHENSHTADDEVIHSICLQQMAPWLGAPINPKNSEEVYRSINETVRSVFLYRVSAGGVELLEKPGYRLRETFSDSTQPEPEGRVIFREEFIRANMYRDFFSRCLAELRVIREFVIAIDVNDAPVTSVDAPVFAFQKPSGGNTVLIPDVDFLHYNFYIPPDHHDHLRYEEKVAKAIFAGSTTGGRTITEDDVRDLTIPRLRSGVYFRGSDQVDFRIPRIVQCKTPEVAEMVAALGINNQHCSWSEQFKHRFILSMDGNGATCSRVAIGLLSSSVLVKYDSASSLYYFGALVPWRHFIPVMTDAEVISIVEAERRHDRIFESVADAGRDFARRYLGRRGVCSYSAQLVRLFQSCLSLGSGGSFRVDERSHMATAETSDGLVELGAHIQGIGDVWSWPGEWTGDTGSGRAIEAIAIIPSGIPQDAITFDAIYKDGSVFVPPEGAYLYGTRGQDKPLHGFTLKLNGDWAKDLTCSYQGRFIDGSSVGPLQAGEDCRSPTNAPLEAFEIVLKQRAV